MSSTFRSFKILYARDHKQIFIHFSKQSQFIVQKHSAFHVGIIFEFDYWKQFPQSCREFNKRKDEEDCNPNVIKQEISYGNKKEIPREITLADIQNFEGERQSMELNKEDAWKSVMMDEPEHERNEEITFEQLRIKHASG